MTARLTLLVVLALGLGAFAGCLGAPDAPVEPTTSDDPVNDTPDDLLPDTITSLEPIVNVETDGGGTGIWIDEDRKLLLSANGGGGLHVFNLSDPADPVLVGHLGDDVYARDVDILEWNGQHLALLAGGSQGMHVVDVTDPTAPTLLATADAYSVHNVASIPGTPYVYDSTGTSDRVIPVLDVRDPTNPEWVTFPIPDTLNGVPVQSNGCHDVTVRVDLGRAYCAGGGNYYAQGGGETFIWDISEDPLNPDWIGVIDNPSIIYHHQALASEDGNLLFINDEYIAPNCFGVEAGPLTVGQTTAAMWVYDVSDPANPELQGWVQPPINEARQNCGSHFGDLIDGRDVLVWGWYQGGALLIDVSDPANPTILDRAEPDGSTWDARYAFGHVYGSSGSVQVLQVVGDGASGAA